MKIALRGLKCDANLRAQITFFSCPTVCLSKENLSQVTVPATALALTVQGSKAHVQLCNSITMFVSTKPLCPLYLAL